MSKVRSPDWRMKSNTQLIAVVPLLAHQLRKARSTFLSSLILSTMSSGHLKYWYAGTTMCLIKIGQRPEPSDLKMPLVLVDNGAPGRRGEA